MQSWLFQQSGRSRLLRIQWIRFNAQGLRMFTSPFQDQPGRFVPLSEILLVTGPKPRHDLSSFKLVTPSGHIVLCSKEEALVSDWVNCIRQALLVPVKTSPQPEQMLCAAFAELQTVLVTRQAQLAQLNDEEYARLQVRGLEQLASVSSALASLQSEATRLREMRASLGASLALMRVLPRKEVPVPSCSWQVPLFCANPGVLDCLVASHTGLSCVDPDELSFARSKVTRAVKWHYCGHKVDALTFKVSANVVLTGVGICAPCQPTGVTFLKEFAILEGPSTNSVPVYVRGTPDQLTYERQKALYIVKLPAVQLKKGQEYTVFMICAGSPTFKCVDSASTHYVGGAVKWSFSNAQFAAQHVSNCSDVRCGPIVEFRFKTQT